MAASTTMNDARRMLEALRAVPPGKQFLLTLAMDSFIAGLTASDNLASAETTADGPGPANT